MGLRSTSGRGVISTRIVIKMNKNFFFPFFFVALYRTRKWQQHHHHHHHHHHHNNNNKKQQCSFLFSFLQSCNIFQRIRRIQLRWIAIVAGRITIRIVNRFRPRLLRKFRRPCVAGTAHLDTNVEYTLHSVITR